MSVFNEIMKLANGQKAPLILMLNFVNLLTLINHKLLIPDLIAAIILLFSWEEEIEIKFILR